MSVNRVAPEHVDNMGGYTYNAFPPDGYEGLVLVLAAVRLGDHAHVEVSTGRWFADATGDPTMSSGRAGGMVLAWADWLELRGWLEPLDGVRVAEVEYPTRGQLDRYAQVIGRTS